MGGVISTDGGMDCVVMVWCKYVWVKTVVVNYWLGAKV